MTAGDSSRLEVDAMTSLVEAVPGAEAVLAEHVADHGQILSHLLMADLRRFFVDLVGSGDAELVAQFLDAVEVLASSNDERLRNVVEVSFIEDLVLGDDERGRFAIETMRPLIGPSMAKSLAVSESFYPRPQ